MSNRLVWADITRILAIYLILVLHFNSVSDLSQTNFIYCVGLTLADTCVPLLVMLSGALLLGKQESYTVFIKKRVSRVVVPWIVWTCIFTAITLYFQANSSFGHIFSVFHMIFVPFFWFIVLVCALYALTPALRIFVHAANIKDILIVVLLWFLTLSVLPYIRNTQAFPLNIGNGVVQLVINFIGYFLIGFLIAKMRRQKKYMVILAIIFLVSLVGRSILVYLSIHNHVNLLSGSDFIDPGLIILSVSLFSFVYILEDVYQHFFNSWVKNKLSLISNATLGIYFVHYLFLNRAPLPTFLPTISPIHVSYNIDAFMNAFIFFIISFLIIFGLQKILPNKHLIA